MGGALEPVTFTIQQDHAYQRKVRGSGCDHCKQRKYHPAHLGAPPSMNDGGSGMDRMAYQSMKKAWQAVLLAGIIESGLEPCESIVVTARIGFPTRAGRDEDNYRWFLAKALGDTLVQNGYLPDDTFWPVRRFTFSGLEAELTPRTSSTSVVLFPSLAEPVSEC